MPAGTKVAKAEQALSKSAVAKGFSGRRKDAYVYGTLNKIGLKQGNKSTKRGLQKA
jgi:hypothetical protein